ncbi:DUF2946 domain-containing protein [Tatumella ptyseos]|uniref:DUF2946 domain-containing protein n=1 Tax=Tatumella ptyseos TaxID=82987 RepID=UPI0026EE57DD|nr:DUF2946 domain-containing protein [Tatumella ptyseos]WKX26737.1 DUF2946 domain-containing protein [Tatumella ptyseos]
MFLTPVKYRLAAVLAVLSILLLFIAPLISQSLYLYHASHTMHTEPRCSEDMTGMGDMSQMSDAMMSHNMSADKSDHTSLPASGMVCGYCELLVHFPFFAWIAAAILWLLSALALTPPQLPYRTIVLTPCYPPQLSRGPPRVLN